MPFTNRAPAGTGSRVLQLTTLQAADVVFDDDDGGYIESAAMRIPQGAFLVVPRFHFLTDVTVFSAHHGLYNATADDTLVSWSWYYNAGASAGSPEPDARLLLASEAQDVVLYCNFGKPADGSVTEISVKLYQLGQIP